VATERARFSLLPPHRAGGRGDNHPVPHAPTLLPVLALVCNAFIWGTSWWPFRWLEGQGLHPLWTTVAVHSLSVLIITLWRPRTLVHVLRHPTLWVLVLAAGVTNAAFNWGVVAGDVVRVVLLFYLMPLWAVFLARLLLNEPITPHGGVRVALALAGAVIVLWPPGGLRADNLPWPRSMPDWLGVIGGMAFALNNVMLRRETAHPPEARALAMFLGGVTVAASLATVLAVQGTVPWPPVPAWGWVVLAAALGLLFLTSNVALQYGAGRLPSNVTSVVMLTEVLFASVSAVWWGGGVITAQLVGGGLCIVAAAVLASMAPSPAH
jgi:drug/metabolite transporter (DMT)-like permease